MPQGNRIPQHYYYGKIECNSLVFALVVMIKVCFSKTNKQTKNNKEYLLSLFVAKGIYVAKGISKSLYCLLATNTDSCTVLVLMHDLKIVENQVG